MLYSKFCSIKNCASCSFFNHHIFVLLHCYGPCLSVYTRPCSFFLRSHFLFLPHALSSILSKQTTAMICSLFINVYMLHCFFSLPPILISGHEYHYIIFLGICMFIRLPLHCECLCSFLPNSLLKNQSCGVRYAGVMTHLLALKNSDYIYTLLTI